MTTPTPDDWRSLQPDVEDLYIRQNWTTTQIRDELCRRGYRVIERTVRSKIEQWGLQKTIRERDILTALDLLFEAHAEGGSLDSKIAIRGKIVGFHELALRLRNNKGIADPWLWRRTHLREGFTSSPHVRLVEENSVLRAERGDHRILSQGSGGVTNGITGSGDAIQGSEPFHLPAVVELDALETALPNAYGSVPLLMYASQDYGTAEGLYHLRNYCWEYLQTRRSIAHVEPLVHRETVHGRFGDHMQNGLALLKKRQVDPAFAMFSKGCALIKPLLDDDHPMSLSLLLAVVCELAAHDAAAVVGSVLRQAAGLCRPRSGKSVSLQKLLELLLTCPDFGWYACQYAIMCLDVFEADNPFKWKTLYVKERLCDCLYHCNRLGTGSSKRSSLLLEQENFYGKNARNVLWTLTNVADDRLNVGDYEGAVRFFQSAFDRAQNIDGFGKAKVQFAAQEGLARARFAQAARLSQYLQDQQIRLQRDGYLQTALDHIDRAIDIGLVWFDSASRRITRALDLKTQIESFQHP